jgi:lipopolysaccharide/colanic/teichoic acid biosynthesis glycosyltransferase
LPLWQAIRAEYARLLSAAREDESWAESTKPLQAVRNKALIWQRVFDISVSLLGLLLLAPVIAIVALAIRINMGAPVIFRQSRPGRDGTLFQILKFRTMSDRRDEQRLLPDEQRLGWFGKFLRSTSLDELPELWNVLRGEMNLVGPRPLLVQYLPLYTARQSRRHEVKPGITGWAQVNGRNALTWERKFELDVWYVDHWSVWLDLKIICITVVKVLRRDGISQRGHATIAEFMGSTHITGQHE